MITTSHMPQSAVSQSDIRMSSAPTVELIGISKNYLDKKTPFPAVSNLSLTVMPGEIVALLGPSGCGKTTLLRMIAGFEAPHEGRILLKGQEIVGPHCWVQPEKRNIGFVFQDYALFPHLNVLHNVAFGLKGMPKKQRLERAKEVIDLVGLTIFSKRHPHQLSGGQQQRVALARALAPEPSVILLDEPFSNLDAALRGSTREEVRRILKQTQTSTILVTHDQEEAMTFADRLAVMRAGKLEQIGLPETVYLQPRTAFVASFLGTTNLIRGNATQHRALTPLGSLPLAHEASGNVLLSLRPEDLAFNDQEGVAVTIVAREFKGHDLTYTCQMAESNSLLTVQTTPDIMKHVGDKTRLKSKGTAVPLEGSSDILSPLKRGASQTTPALVGHVNA